MQIDQFETTSESLNRVKTNSTLRDSDQILCEISICFLKLDRLSQLNLALESMTRSPQFNLDVTHGLPTTHTGMGYPSSVPDKVLLTTKS